jgi:peptidyl-prolyl cis-trans isomerase D
MISFIRSLINSRFGAILALIFVGLIAIGFTLGDVTGSGSFGGLGGGNVAKVGKQNVTLGEFNEALTNRLRAERKQNPTLDMVNFVQSGGFDSTLSQLINRYGLANFAEASGMSVSKRLVDYEIRKLPGSKGMDGKFSQEALQRFLTEIQISEKTLREDFRQNFYAQQLLPAAQFGPKMPANLALPYASLLLEKRSGQVAIIPSQLFLPKEAPAPAVLEKFYRDNSARFTIPEKRAISYVIFDRSIVDGKNKPSEAEIASYYKANAAKYSASETRSISQIIVPTEAAAQSVLTKIAGGQSIAEVAKSLGLAVTAEQNVSRQALTTAASKSVSDAVFSGKPGSIATPAKGSLGWYVIKVDAVNQVAARTMDSARVEIEKDLIAEKKLTAIGEFTSEIEDAFANGSTINDVAKTHNLTVQTTPKLFANGQDPANPGYKPVPEMQAIIPAAFQMEQDGDAQLIEVTSGERFAMVAVADVEAAAPPPLATVTQIIAQNWAAEQGAMKAKTVADQVSKAVSAGKSLNEALAALKINLPPAESISGSRGELRQQGQELPPPLVLMFSMKQGTAKSLKAPRNAGWFVVSLNDIKKGDAAQNAELLKATTAEMVNLVQQEHAAQLVAAALKSVGVKKNVDALASLRSRLTSINDRK